MKTKVLIAIALAVGLFSIHANAYDSEKVLSLRGTWKFAIGDNEQWADPTYDDSDWARIYVPSEWEDEGFRGYSGYAWYRRHFDLDKSEDFSSYYLYLGEIDDVDEVFLNGERIGGTGSFHPYYQTAYNIPRRYPIPIDVLKPTDNVISVRVFDEGGPGGILGWKIGIYGVDQPIPPQMILYGNWKFKLGDHSDWKEQNHDDSEWDSIRVPGNWESQGFWNYDGFAWYRKKAVIPETLSSRNLVLLLGKIDDVDQVFVNGEMIGSTGKMYEYGARVSGYEWEEIRGYPIPGHLISPGGNIQIAVRVYDGLGDGGIYEGPVGIMDSDQYQEFWRNEFNYSSFWSRFFSSW